MRTHTTSICGVATAALALAMSAAACGGGGGSAPPNCLQVQPCGGDVVGTWSFLGGCSNTPALSAQLAQFCPGAALNGFGMSLTGTLSFNADSSYTASDWHQTFAASETLPLSCVGTPTCADASMSTTDTAGGSTQTINTTCSGSTICNCRVSGTSSITADTGSWYVAGTSLDMLGGATSAVFSYCVEGERLHLIDVDGLTILNDLVLQRL